MDLDNKEVQKLIKNMLRHEMADALGIPATELTDYAQLSDFEKKRLGPKLHRKNTGYFSDLYH